LGLNTTRNREPEFVGGKHAFYPGSRFPVPGSQFPVPGSRFPFSVSLEIGNKGYRRIKALCFKFTVPTASEISKRRYRWKRSSIFNVSCSRLPVPVALETGNKAYRRIKALCFRFPVPTALEISNKRYR
jgi:hypothetical protein